MTPTLSHFWAAILNTQVVATDFVKCAQLREFVHSQDDPYPDEVPSSLQPIVHMAIYELSQNNFESMSFNELLAFHMKGKHNQKTHGGNAAHIPDVTDTLRIKGTDKQAVATDYMDYQGEPWLRGDFPGSKKWHHADTLEVVSKGAGIGSVASETTTNPTHRSTPTPQTKTEKEILDDVKSEGKAWASGLEQRHKDAADQYIQFGDTEINNKLRAGQDLGVHAKTVRDLDDAIAKSPGAPYDMTIHRGISKSFHDSLKDGQELTDPGYTSSTLARSTAVEFASHSGGDVISVKVPKGSPGAYLDAAGKYPMWGEWIVPRGSTFKVEKTASGTKLILQPQPLQFHLKGKHNQKSHGGGAAHVPDVSDTLKVKGTNQTGTATHYMDYKGEPWLKLNNKILNKLWHSADTLEVVHKGPGIDSQGHIATGTHIAVPPTPANAPGTPGASSTSAPAHEWVQVVSGGALKPGQAIQTPNGVGSFNKSTYDKDGYWVHANVPGSTKKWFQTKDVQAAVKEGQGVPFGQHQGAPAKPAAPASAGPNKHPTADYSGGDYISLSGGNVKSAIKVTKIHPDGSVETDNNGKPGVLSASCAALMKKSEPLASEHVGGWKVGDKVQAGYEVVSLNTTSGKVQLKAPHTGEILEYTPSQLKMAGFTPPGGVPAAPTHPTPTPVSPHTTATPVKPTVPTVGHPWVTPSGATGTVTELQGKWVKIEGAGKKKWYTIDEMVPSGSQSASKHPLTVVGTHPTGGKYESFPWHSSSWGPFVEAWENSLTSSERNAVATYTNSAYSSINSNLRYGGKPTSSDLRRDTALAKSKTPVPMIVHRRVYSDIIGKKGLTIGQVFEDKGYFSTSTSSQAWPGDTYFRVRVPAGSSGAYIAGVSAHSTEREFLLPRGSRFRILSRKQESGQTQYELELVP